MVEKSASKCADTGLVSTRADAESATSPTSCFVADKQASSTYYPGLDALRAVAAVVVVFYHLFLPLGIVFSPKGYLAVDFFFMLSGFVIANAYQARLTSNLTTARFILLRIARLYPLLAFGMCMGIVVSAIKIFYVTGSNEFFRFLFAAMMGLVMLPFGKMPNSTSTEIYPFNGPAWSLFFELSINYAYAVAFLHMRLKMLKVVIFLSGLWLFLQFAFLGDVDFGSTYSTFILGIPRVTFSFLAGTMLYRFTTKEHSHNPKIGGFATSFAPLTALFLILVLPSQLASWLDAVSVFILFPFLILFTAVCNTPNVLISLFRFAGALSYPLYVTHFPILRVFQFLIEKYKPEKMQLVALVFVEFVVVVFASYFALRIIDQPCQRFLRRALIQRR